MLCKEIPSSCSYYILNYYYYYCTVPYSSSKKQQESATTISQKTWREETGRKGRNFRVIYIPYTATLLHYYYYYSNTSCSNLCLCTAINYSTSNVPPPPSEAAKPISRLGCGGGGTRWFLEEENQLLISLVPGQAKKKRGES